MSRCEFQRDYKGVVLRCIKPAGHDDPNGPAFDHDALHDIDCHVCAGETQDYFPEPGIRCIKHGTREPQ